MVRVDNGRTVSAGEQQIRGKPVERTRVVVVSTMTRAVEAVVVVVRFANTRVKIQNYRVNVYMAIAEPCFSP